MSLQGAQMAATVSTALGALDALGLDAPPTVAQARAAYLAALACEGPPLDLTGIVAGMTPDEVVAHIERAADTHGRRADVLAVRDEIIDRCAGIALGALNAATDSILGKAAEVVRPAMAALEVEFRSLPTGWEDSQRLIDTGTTDAVAAFLRAKAETKTLDAARELRGSLPACSVIGAVANGAEFAEVSDSVVAEAVCRCNGQGSLGIWGQILAVEGVTGLHWFATVAEHRAYTATVPQMQMRHVREGHGAVLRKVPA